MVQGVFLLLFVSFLCYGLMALMPGDPVDLMAQSNPHITAADVAQLKALYGLDLPVYERYWNWLTHALSGDLGYSRTYKVPVTDLIGPRLLNTFFLSFTALILSLCIAIPLGILSAVRQGTKFDNFVSLVSLGLQAVPQFWLGLLMIFLFSVTLKWLPPGGTESIDQNLEGMERFWDRVVHMILPITVFTVVQVATYLRFTRASMIETLKADFIRTARAKGLSPTKVLSVHALRNALLPLITVVALGLSGVFSGAIITEQVFSYQGVGKLVYDSIVANDFNVAMVSFTITVGMVVIMNTVADICYAIVDPRVKVEGGKA